MVGCLLMAVSLFTEGAVMTTFSHSVPEGLNWQRGLYQHMVHQEPSAITNFELDSLGRFLEHLRLWCLSFPPVNEPNKARLSVSPI